MDTPQKATFSISRQSGSGVAVLHQPERTAAIPDPATNPDSPLATTKLSLGAKSAQRPLPFSIVRLTENDVRLYV